MSIYFGFLVGQMILARDFSGPPAGVNQLRGGTRRTWSPVVLPLAERLWARVKKSDGCWVWTGGLTNDGYGSIQVEPRSKRKASVHRVAYELSVGPIPDGLHVLHRCDNPPCVRPDHLFLGTHADNMADKVAKGRARGTPREELAALWDDGVRGGEGGGA